jgi:hypothetical protein
MNKHRDEEYVFGSIPNVFYILNDETFHDTPFRSTFRKEKDEKWVSSDYKREQEQERNMDEFIFRRK